MRVLGVDPGLTRCGVGVVEGVAGRPLTMIGVGVLRTPADAELGHRLVAVEQGIEQWLDEHRPEFVAVERVFSQHNVRTAMGTAQASAVAILCASRRGIPVALHTPSEVKAAVTGSGRADKAQVGAMVTRLLRLAAPAQARRRRRRPRPRHLPHLARPRAEPPPAGRGPARAAPCPPHPARPERPYDMIAFVSGTVAALAPDAAVVEVGGVGMAVQCTPNTLSTLRLGKPAKLATSLVVREDSLTLYGFADDDERQVFELLQTASGVGPRLAQAMLAVHQPDALRRAVSTGDEKALTAVPGIGKKGAQKLLLELKDRLGEPVGAPVVGAPVSSGWRDQLHAALIGLGYATREADEAVAAVAPQAEAAGGTPQVGALLKAALQTLNRAR
ncbi:Holliday junction DNA helicase RuvA subunit/crossover junction endodeoxyribonuclease RuvC [Streptomyces collinus]